MSIQTLRLSGLLSFAPESTPLELRNLNVLIGPNGSGKSNLIEALELLAAMPRDLSATIRDGGGPGLQSGWTSTGSAISGAWASWAPTHDRHRVAWTASARHAQRGYRCIPLHRPDVDRAERPWVGEGGFADRRVRRVMIARWT